MRGILPPWARSIFCYINVQQQLESISHSPLFSSFSSHCPPAILPLVSSLSTASNVSSGDQNSSSMTFRTGKSVRNHYYYSSSCFFSPSFANFLTHTDDDGTIPVVVSGSGVAVIRVNCFAFTGVPPLARPVPDNFTNLKFQPLLEPVRMLQMPSSPTRVHASRYEGTSMPVVRWSFFFF